jgi:uncharacterized integral membrane protein
MSLPQSPDTPNSATQGATPASSGGPPAPVHPEQPPNEPHPQVKGTRTGRVWVAVCAAALITVLLIIFMIQNTHTVRVSFLGMTGSTSLALMLLIAAVGGILATLFVGSVRIIQLRHAVRRRRS